MAACAFSISALEIISTFPLSPFPLSPFFPASQVDVPPFRVCGDFLRRAEAWQLMAVKFFFYTPQARAERLQPFMTIDAVRVKSNGRLGPGDRRGEDHPPARF